ncbi:hypothetical protein CKAH01_14808 [Colletotrichum kahawae]|uniref:Uncharacterized protein n=1 Tax=Colletotrichum kahawae TaxID=34407 RepID=A0AAE0D849_COLKA|nr:hypothetical protein CKAH01_14808 [Colletotrichum kahawae]
MSFFRPPDCSVDPATISVAGNAGIAGTAVLLSFTIAATIALLLSWSIVLFERKERPSSIRRKLLNGYSDTQILQGIAISILGLATTNRIVPYHFFIIWCLSNMSMAVHNATLLIYGQLLRQDWLLRTLRQSLLIVNLPLNCTYGGLILKSLGKGMKDSKLPVGCVWTSVNGTSGGGSAIDYAGTIAVIVANVLVFLGASWYIHSRGKRFARPMIIGGLVLMTASAIGAAVRSFIASSSFGDGPHGYKLADDSEKRWEFGQFLSILVLLFPIVSLLEIWRGEIMVAEPVCEDMSDDQEKML